jgi:anti-anti-sigma factor
MSLTDTSGCDSALQITVEQTPLAHVCLQGSLDALTAPALVEEAEVGLPLHEGWLLVDASGLAMLTSCGAGALDQVAAQAAEQGGGVVMVLPPGRVREVARIMRLDRIIVTLPSLEEAAAFIRGAIGVASMT